MTCLGACTRHDKSWRRSTEGVSGILNLSIHVRVKLEIPLANTGGVLGYVFYSSTEQFLSPYNIVYRVKLYKIEWLISPGLGHLNSYLARIGGKFEH